jgi:hypothetical protein
MNSALRTSLGPGLAAALILLLALGGCASSPDQKGGLFAADRSSTPVYLDFGDILIPRELEVDKSGSFIFKTMGLTAGVLSLEGGVDVNSLIKFFENNLTKDNWQQMSSFKSVRSILLFQKDTRWCVINITEKQFKTYVEVWVAPSSAEGQSGLFK